MDDSDNLSAFEIPTGERGALLLYREGIAEGDSVLMVDRSRVVIGTATGTYCEVGGKLRRLFVELSEPVGGQRECWVADDRKLGDAPTAPPLVADRLREFLD